MLFVRRLEHAGESMTVVHDPVGHVNREYARKKQRLARDVDALEPEKSGSMDFLRPSLNRQVGWV